MTQDPRITTVGRFLRATSLDELGRRLGAGTGCGGCLPTLEDLLEEAQEQRAASPISADSPHEIALAAS